MSLTHESPHDVSSSDVVRVLDLSARRQQQKATANALAPTDKKVLDADLWAYDIGVC